MKTIFKTILTVITVAFFVFAAASCKTTSALYEPEKQAGRMFWKIEGTDKKGKPSAVYILGTIHIGDERLYPLADETADAFINADQIAAEISSSDMTILQQEIQMKIKGSYLRADGRNVMQFLEPGQVETIKELMGQNAASLALFEPWVLQLVINQLMMQKTGYNPEYGLDNQLMNTAKLAGKTWTGLDDIETQLDILSAGSYSEQIYWLKELLSSVSEGGDYKEQIDELYNAYLEDDIQKIAQIYEESRTAKDPSMQKATDEKNRMMIDERNKKWAAKIKKWLNEGGNTFIFAGCLHFAGDRSVFTFLK